MTFSLGTIKWLVGFLTILNFIAVLLGVFVFILSIVANSQNYQIIFQTVFSAALIFGFQKKKPWIVPIMILVSSFGILGNFLYSPANSFWLGVKILGFIFGIFWLYFFTRKEVRAYFNAKGVWLF